MLDDDLQRRLGDVAGVLVPGRDDVARFDEPARGEPGRAALVTTPATADEVAGVVRICVAERVRMLPQGANTGLVGASVAPAEPPTVVLSTERLRRTIEIDADAATAAVGAGTRLSELNAAAAEHGLHLPIDVGSDPAIGGMVATNTGGCRVLRYGPMRRYVLAAEIVAADEAGSRLGSLHALGKDSRGLDVTQLAVGSGGTLGVVVGAVIGLVPMPCAVQTWWLAAGDHGRVLELLAQFERRRPGAVSAFELVSRAALERALATEGSPPSPFGAALPEISVLAEWSFADDDAPGVEDDIDAAFSSELIADGRLVDPATAWALRHRISDSLRAYGVVLGHDVAVPRSALMDVRRRAAAAVAELAPEAVMCDFGHAGDGGLHLNVLVPAEAGPPSPTLAAAIRAAIDDIVLAAGGSYSAEHGLGPLNAERWLATTPPIEQRLVAALKDTVDPHGLLGHPAHPYNRLRRPPPEC